MPYVAKARTQQFTRRKSNLVKKTLLNQNLYDPLAALAVIQSGISYVIRGSFKTETFARCLLNNIVLYCIATEKRYAEHHIQTTPAAVPEDRQPRTQTPSPQPAELLLRFETELAFPVNFKKEKRQLVGKADFTLWYDDEDSMGTNLVVVEAKCKGTASLAAGQLIAYMGIVHRIRKAEGRHDAVAFGIATDGDEFRFWRIDNDSVVTRSLLYDWSGNGSRHITSIIWYIVRAAVASSPTTTPIKSGACREVSLDMFHGSNTCAFDYNIHGPIFKNDDPEDEMFDEVYPPNPFLDVNRNRAFYRPTA